MRVSALFSVAARASSPASTFILRASALLWTSVSRPTTRTRLEILYLAPDQKRSLPYHDSFEPSALNKLIDGLKCHATNVCGLLLTDQIGCAYFFHSLENILSFLNTQLYNREAVSDVTTPGGLTGAGRSPGKVSGPSLPKS